MEPATLASGKRTTSVVTLDVTEQQELLHELSTILESTTAGIAYIRGNKLVRCNQRFERMLVDEGVLLLKFWFHLSKKDQKARLKSLEKDPLTRWRVTREDWRRFEHYDRFRKVSEVLVRRTSTTAAPALINTLAQAATVAPVV